MYCSQFNTEIGHVIVEASEHAVLAIRFADGETKHAQGILPNPISESAVEQLTEYFAAKRTEFDLPLAPKGTAFQQQVWHALLNVPHGKTASYLSIAKHIGNPKACRAVGAANSKNPISIVIPCHRIVGANGSLTGYAGGMTRKSYLLNLEKAH
jgi:methylated-DNA-[protein]-cysteine S-methyltransferase